MTATSAARKRTPLYTLHLERGARMVAFAGYDMPVQYPLGILKEHLHVRAAVGLFDVSHMGQFAVRAASGNLNEVASALETLLPVIGHMQFADVPGRHEPGTGEIGWEFVFRRIDELGYTGWVCAEYTPAGDTVAGLAWRQRYGV